MKYMGSKRFMLQNGLGELICEQAQYSKRFVDLFCGAGSVAWFAATNIRLPVLAIDLQAYAVVLAQAVIGRNISIDESMLAAEWLKAAKRARTKSRLWPLAVSLEEKTKAVESIRRLVFEARRLCAELSSIGPIWNSYGGHYFSPAQALTLDYMLKYLPLQEPNRTVCVAAMISAASKCAASPGHTAQPFQPTKTARKFVQEAWLKDPISLAQVALNKICPRHARVTGKSLIADAVEVASDLKSGDLVFIDPPYSGVQYSRFYHVLETLARGSCATVTGVGRYPPFKDRPQSAFSNKSQSINALQELIETLAPTGATIIFTFPSGKCSNGLSGELVLQTAQKFFDVSINSVIGRFSTLGGNNSYRASRKTSNELILLMKHPKRLRRH